jgi:hypothetical protein
MTKIQSLKADVATAVETLQILRNRLKAAQKQEKLNRIAEKEFKAQDREAKKALRIEKLKAKLEALQNPPVGLKAKRAAKKPSKVVSVVL